MFDYGNRKQTTQGFSKKTIFWIKERIFYVAWYTLLVSIVFYWALKHILP